MIKRDTRHITRRQLQIAQEIRSIIGRIFSENSIHVTSLNLNEINISEVEVTPDLKFANVFIVFRGSSSKKDPRFTRLCNTASRIRWKLGANLRLRCVPSIRFIHDTSVERGAKIDALLKLINNNEKKLSINT